MTGTNAIKTSRPCPISDSNDGLLLASKDRHGRELTNVISSESGLIFVDPVPFHDTESFYKNDYRKSYKGISVPKNKHIYRAGQNALKRFGLINSLIDFGGDVLDAGSSSGEFVYLLKSKGISARGIEANEGYANFSSQELGIGVDIQAFSKFSPNAQFDAITMFHVLEHLENPVDDLTHLTQFLKHEGHLIIEVPNIMYGDMAFSNKWHPGHLFSYCKETLRALGVKLSMQIVFCDTITDGGNLFAVMKKSKSSPVEKFQFPSAEEKLKLLHEQKIQYYFNPLNYIKFSNKIARSFNENRKTKGLSAAQILGSLYD